MVVMVVIRVVNVVVKLINLYKIVSVKFIWSGRIYMLCSYYMNLIMCFILIVMKLMILLVVWFCFVMFDNFKYCCKNLVKNR